jgi:alkanesulfonate monooxygenase SsuD/methylene tetrahydromethanopterin reductase-like flavin-dependent oxidoreductase (luciferase family)
MQPAESPAVVGDGTAEVGVFDSDFPADHPYARLVAAPLVEERPELFVLGSSPYGPRFAAVNGMSAVFAHHMSPDLAFEALRGYRREFTPRAEGGFPYSAMSVLAPRGVNSPGPAPADQRDLLRALDHTHLELAPLTGQARVTHLRSAMAPERRQG